MEEKRLRSKKFYLFCLQSWVKTNKINFKVIVFTHGARYIASSGEGHLAQIISGTHSSHKVYYFFAVIFGANESGIRTTF